MTKKPTQKTFHFNTIIGGQVIAGKVAFSPAPEPGILTEIELQVLGNNALLLLDRGTFVKP